MIEADVNVLDGLGHAVRRRLYELVAAADGPIGRDEAAAAAGISRSLAAYHLDRLVAVGLLEASFSRRGERSGPGAGRPAKLYRRAQQEFVLSVPPRDYELLGELLARSAAGDASGAVRTALDRAARAHGRDFGEAAKDRVGDDPDALAILLRARGYEPFEEEPGTWRLRNCPFDRLAKQYTDVVCGLNLELIQGLLRGLGAGAQAALEPGPGRCCVAIRTTT